MAEYVDALKIAMELDIIIKCKTAGDYSLASSTESAAPVTGFTKTWRMYRCHNPLIPDLTPPICMRVASALHAMDVHFHFSPALPCHVTCALLANHLLESFLSVLSLKVSCLFVQLHSQAMGDEGACMHAGSCVLPHCLERGHHRIRDKP